MPCLFPVLSVLFMKTTAFKLTLGFGTGCFCCCGDDWLIFCGDVAAFWKTWRKALLYTRSCNYRYMTWRALLKVLFLCPSSSLQSHGLDSCSLCSRYWIQSQLRERLSALRSFVIFLSPSMQTMALGSTQPLNEGGKGGRCIRLTTYHHPVPLSWNLGTLTSWNPLGLSRPIMGLLYLYLQCKYQKTVSN